MISYCIATTVVGLKVRFEHLVVYNEVTVSSLRV